MAAASLVVEPFTFSVKVVPFMEDNAMFSEKVALTLAVGETPVALDAGTVLVTVGAVVSPGAEDDVPWHWPLAESEKVLPTTGLQPPDTFEQLEFNEIMCQVPRS